MSDQSVLNPTEISSKDRNGRLGVAVELYRDASGSNVVRRPCGDWVRQMGEVAGSNYGRISVVLHPECSPGYDNKHGVVIAIVPGMLSGKLGRGGEDLKQPIHPLDLPHYGNAGGIGFNSGVLTIDTNLDDAIRLHKALGKVILNARRLSARNQKKNAA